MRNVLALLALVSTTGCFSPVAVRAETEELALHDVRKLVFVKEPKTGLCFGYIPYIYSAAIVHVPCDKVGL